MTNFILRHEDGSQLILTLTSARTLASMPLLSWKNGTEERDKPPLSLQGIPGQVNRPTDSAALELTEKQLPTEGKILLEP